MLTQEHVQVVLHEIVETPIIPRQFGPNASRSPPPWRQRDGVTKVRAGRRAAACGEFHLRGLERRRREVWRESTRPREVGSGPSQAPLEPPLSGPLHVKRRALGLGGDGIGEPTDGGRTIRVCARV